MTENCSNFEAGYSETTPILGGEEKRCTAGLPKRYIFIFLGFWGFFNVYAMRVNLSVALVAMVLIPPPTHLTESSSIACYELISQNLKGNSSIPIITTSVKDRFPWDSEAQSVILGSFFYGYVITQIPGGTIAERYGAKWLYGIGIFVTSFFTLLTPFAARWGVWSLVLARAIEGLGEGVTFPAMNAMIAKWSPKLERSRMASFIYNGSAIGTVVSLAVSGILCATVGWPWVFYLFGVLGMLWCIPWICMVYESPETHPEISKKEKNYILRGQDERSRNTSIPWRAILTSGPVWALAVTHFGQGWGFYTLLTEMPTYLFNILHFDIKKNGALSAVPYVMQAFCSVLASFIADKLRATGRYRITTIRKIFNSLAFFIPGLCVFLVGFVGCNPVIIMILFALSMGFNGLIHSGFNVTHVDMSPDFAGTLMGITNCVANLSGFLAPAFVGRIIKSGQTVHNWTVVFVTTSVVYFVSGLVYNVFCTAEVQPWGKSGNTYSSRETGERNGDPIKTSFIDNPR